MKTSFYDGMMELFLEYLTLGPLVSVVVVPVEELNILFEENWDVFHLKD